jgi:hypothetical protein
LPFQDVIFGMLSNLKSAVESRRQVEENATAQPALRCHAARRVLAQRAGIRHPAHNQSGCLMTTRFAGHDG